MQLKNLVVYTIEKIVRRTINHFKHIFILKTTTTKANKNSKKIIKNKNNKNYKKYIINYFFPIKNHKIA